MYNLAEGLPIETVTEIQPGTSLLIAGPAMSGKPDLALDLLAPGLDGGNGLLLVTTNETATAYLDRLERRVTELDQNRVGIVDCSGSSQQGASPNLAIQRVSSPGDLTGISIGTAKLMKQFTHKDISSVRHGLISISTLLQYLDLHTVFKFLHIYTTRITDTQGMGLFTIDDDSHDPQTINTLSNEFDGIVELRETETGEREIRLRGLADASNTWEPFNSET